MRLAGDADDEALAALLRTIPFGGPTPFVEERAPSVEELRRLELAGTADVPRIYVIETPEGRLAGCLSLCIQSGRVGPDSLSVGHLADIRLSEDLRRGRVFPRALAAVLEHARRTRNVEICHTAFLGHDAAAFHALLGRDERRYIQPMGQVMTAYDLVTLPVDGKRAGQPERMVQRAREEDIGPIAEFLASGQATRRLGENITEAQLRSRLKTWPVFDIGHFFVVRGSHARIMACAALWDPNPVRTFRVHPPASQGFVARVAGRLLGAPGARIRLPPPGSAVEGPWLTHLEVHGDDPGLLRDLLLGILRELEDTEVEQLHLGVPRSAPLAGGVQGLRPTAIPVALVALSHAGTAWNNIDFRTHRARFEPAFA